MRQLLGNIEEFIALIQKRPELYNFTLNAFNDKDLTQKLWQEIACEFNTNVGYCKTKWSTLRVSFARQMRNEEESAKTGKPLNDWYLRDNMSFMRDYMRKRKKRKSSEKDIENSHNSDSSSKSTIAVKTETILSNSSLEIKKEPIFLDDNESLASLDIDSNEDFIEDNRVNPDVVSVASSSVSNSEANSSIDNHQVKETFNKYPAAKKSRKRRKVAPNQENQSLKFLKIRRTNRTHKPSLKVKENEANDPQTSTKNQKEPSEIINTSQTNDPFLLPSPRNQKERSEEVNSQHKTINEEATMSFFMSILPDFNNLTGRRQRLVKQKLMESLNKFLDEQEDES